MKDKQEQYSRPSEMRPSLPSAPRSRGSTRPRDSAVILIPLDQNNLTHMVEDLLAFILQGHLEQHVDDQHLVCPGPEWCRHLDRSRVRQDIMPERRPKRARRGCDRGGDSPGGAARGCRTA